jgi:hypothetical protein
MASYALLLDCQTGGNPDDNEGLFRSVRWVSSTNNRCPDPNTGALPLNPGDQVTFAVKVNDAAGNLQPGWLNWIVVMVTATTSPGNRGQRYADNNSPFRIGSGSKPNTILLANSAGAGGTWRFTNIGSNGGPDASGPYQGLQSLTVVADRVPGSPTREVSRYEAAVVASITDSTGQLWQYGFDPEMDVNNNN